MSGPQGPDPTQPWPGQPPQSGGAQPPSEQTAWQPPSTPEQPTTEAPAWQPPAYQTPQYPQYQPPAPPPYNPQQYAPQPDQYGQQPTAYAPQGYPQQYGQPQPYDPSAQQYGQPQPYGQPGQCDQQYSPYGAPGPAEEGSKKSLAVIGGVVGLLAAVIVAVVLVLGFWKPGWFVTTKLDVGAAQTGVQQILTDEANGYGAKNVKDVTCNDGNSPTVKKGDSFECVVSIDGTKRQVTVTFQDDKGTYEVGRPK
ncbi:DUF4333 domain-containing protein [Mycolicibacterium fluoranthenivorans]|uniref:DUF4333 domain-containing protein n=1 Tax=Mycolicibacterium fluoranthenivorans TaxID=258505 RepID=A0A7X5ZDJ5_9MYCO|nr:DUF4333 domain-containing protein [Mycolicibacterium fluoranthenivorans]MCV7357754.1 DUF4333 domain-containing protein [Mycolicibacterium fluoranthenivorans]NIH96130.1 hypothetical protein [Mycolicibacterium fluoranthenivorans]